MNRFQEFYDIMRKLDSKINLKIEELNSGFFVIYYSRYDIKGSKVVDKFENIYEEVVEIYEFLNFKNNILCNFVR